MTPQVLRVLTECDTMLAATVTRYTTARRRLAEAEPGYPAHTPGAGEPGGGKGFSAGSITDRLAVLRHPELEAANRLTTIPWDIYAITHTFNRQHIGLPQPDLSNNPLRPLRLICWSLVIINRLKANNIEPRLHTLDQLHRTIQDLHRTVQAWGTPAAVPVKTATNELPDDLTGLWCRNHLRTGQREPRHRGDLCRFCDDIRRLEGFLPPPELLEQRQHQGRIYDRDIEPWRKAHRDRNKKKRKKAG